MIQVERAKTWATRQEYIRLNWVPGEPPADSYKARATYHDQDAEEACVLQWERADEEGTFVAFSDDFIAHWPELAAQYCAAAREATDAR